MAAGQGKTCLVYVAQYISHTRVYISQSGNHQVSGCFIFNQKIHSSNAMTWITKKFASLVLSRESRLPYLRQEIRSA